MSFLQDIAQNSISGVISSLITLVLVALFKNLGLSRNMEQLLKKS